MSFKYFDKQLIPFNKLQAPMGRMHRNDPQFGPATPTNVCTKWVNGGPRSSPVSTHFPPNIAYNGVFILSFT